eukprot:CAMPEP_0174826900 /NCGR_PEP_ID=MMETSP1114-20130205/315_1 /TAXON_ID=312471 /ORGANISM="Neobodo designis, Strain CCAP 1951/1" /LENGTH=145 /DNA_ID=CAMNT_0016060473 /DNA_START=246 /DNA_END=681 /DNA_ORIENTATION=-
MPGLTPGVLWHGGAGGGGRREGGEGTNGEIRLGQLGSRPRRSVGRAQPVELGRLVVHQQGNDQAVEPERLGENEHQDHRDEDLVLLAVRTHGRVADDADGKARGHRREAGGHAGAEVHVAREGRVLVVADLDVVVDDHGDDEAVD